MPSTPMTVSTIIRIINEFLCFLKCPGDAVRVMLLLQHSGLKGGVPEG